jgi:hypothetical protein
LNVPDGITVLDRPGVSDINDEITLHQLNDFGAFARRLESVLGWRVALRRFVAGSTQGLDRTAASPACPAIVSA